MLLGSPTVLDVQPLLKDDLARVRIVFQSDELPVFRLRTADMDDPLWRWNVASRGLGPTPEEYADALRVLGGSLPLSRERCAVASPPSPL